MSTNKSHTKEFNVLSVEYLKNPSYANTTSLSENLSCLCGTSNFKQFETGTINVSNFYKNLYNLINSVDVKSPIFWLCISTLKHASKNLSGRNAIIYEYRFIPILATYLNKLNQKEEEDPTLLFELLQELTYNFQITCQEPYVADLIQTLVNVVLSDKDGLKTLSLSILINLCYKNSSSTYLLMRSINLTDFLNRIKEYGIYTIKLLIILESHSISKDDFVYFVKLSLTDIDKALSNWDVPYLRHIVDFIIDQNNIENLNSSISDDFIQGVDKLLKNIFDHIPITDESVQHDLEYYNKQNLCLSIIFELVNCILNIDKDIKILYPSIINLLHKCVSNENTRGKVYNVLLNIIINDTVNINLTELIQSFGNIFENIFLRNNLSLNEELLSFLKLLNELIENNDTKPFICNLINVNFFQNIFANLLKRNNQDSRNSIVSQNEIHIHVVAMSILIKLAADSPKLWYSQIANLYKEKEIHFILAKALTSGVPELCSTVLAFAKSDIFPYERIAKYMNNNEEFISTNSSMQQGTVFERPVMNSRSLEEKQDQLIADIYKLIQTNNFNEIRSSQIIELYQHKIDTLRSNESSLSYRLNHSSDLITHLTMKTESLYTENKTYERILFASQISEEQLKKDNKLLQQTRDSLQISYKDLYKKLEMEKTSKNNCVKSIEIKNLEIEQLNKQMNEISNNIVESNKRNDELRKTLIEYENDIKKIKLAKIDVENESKITINKLNEMSKEAAKLKECVKSLEKQLALKDEKILSYEQELSETEQMRETILSLMQNKKSKKK